MYGQLASTGAPLYFNPQQPRGVARDYRPEPARALTEKLRQAVEDMAGTIGAAIGSSIGLGGLLESDPRVESFMDAFKEIDRLRIAPSNWSSVSVSAPSTVQCLLAKSALMTMLFAGIRAPRIMLLGDGTLGACWHATDGSYVSIDFDTDGLFPWTAAKGDQLTTGTWNWRHQSIPVDLVGTLNA